MSEALAFPQPFGRYQLIERMAVGGMAEIFRARVVGAHGFSKTVVIKRILPHLASDPSFVSMFIDEAKLTARLEHPKIIQVLDFGEADAQLFIAMEMVDGLDALGVLRACTHKKIRLPFALSVHIMHEVLDALDYAHKARDDDGQPLGIVHRDISPSNVLIARRGDVKLGDFGIARAAERQGKTKAGTLKGKYGYMSPEQVVGGDLDGRSDIFSCAIVLAEMLMGRRLFTAPNELDVLLMVRDVKLDRLEKFGADLPADLRKILDRAFMRERAQRFPTAADFRDELAEWLFASRQRVSAADLASFVAQISDQPEGSRPATQTGINPAAVANPQSRMVRSLLDNESTPQAAVPAPVPTPAPQRPQTGAPGLPAPQPRVEGNDPQPARPNPRTGPPPVGRSPGSSPQPQAQPPSPARVSTAGMPGAQRGRAKLPDSEIPIYVESVRAAIDNLDNLDKTPAPQRVESLELDLNDDDDMAGDAPQLSYNSGRPESILDLPSGPIEISQMQSEQPLPDAPFMPLPEPMRPSADAKPQPAPTGTPAMAVPEHAPDEQGDLIHVSAIRLLSRRACGQQTGLLAVDMNGVSKQIFMVRGTPEFVASNVARELFGEYLKQHNVISESELAMALAMMPHFGGKLGDTLVGLGLLRPLEVFRHLTRQVREKLIDICTWQRGTFRWWENYVNPRESFPLGLDAFEVLGAGSTAIDSSVCEEWLTPRANRRPSVSPGRQKIAPEQFRLGPSPRDILGKLGGRKTVRELVSRYDREDDRLSFLRTLILLVETELVTLL